MPDFENAFNLVCELVKDFKENEPRYLSPQYQEAEVRRDFIDKLFEALGWDVYHRTQKNPYEQEVKVEKGVSIGKAQKRADYAFYINPEYRQPKFFAEAKKPSRSLKNADDYFQTIRYGWNSNTPIAVLTDFEEFHILDCRFKPNINQVLSNPNHKAYKYTDFTDPDKFKEIYYLFSRNDVANNSLEKYADTFPKIKGKQKTAFKSTIQAIDDDFLEYIDEVRETLAKAFKKNDSKLSSEELTEATQRTIDRIVFIRFLEDKLIEPEYYISEFGKKGNAWSEFISVCRKLDAKYNGIVFKKHFIDEQNFQGPEQSTFKKICDEMSYLNSPYDFNAIPIHILGSIYERFLGKVVNATAQRVKVEEKPEVRKAGGVYYTPKYIVDYIVDNTVGKILRNENDSTPLVPKLQLGNAKTVEDPDLSGLGNGTGLSPKEISKLSFADIACGSGSFLIGVFETLLKYHTEYYQHHPDEAKKDGCINKDGQWILSIKQKQNILLNNIYGVDIDNQAVEVTQLSLALKMLEDESTATANEMQVLFHEKILPDLSKNIVCGNSLIGTDILQGKMFPTEEERKLNPMDFETMFPEVFRNGGFDAIVGNPPWGANFTEIELEYFRKHYSSIIVRMIDSFMYFVYKSSCLLKSSGFFGMILPDVILYQKDNIKLREYIIHNKQIINLLNLGNGVFKYVNRPTCIVIYCNKFIPDNYAKAIDLSNVKDKSQLLLDIDYQLIKQDKYREINDMNLITSGVSNFELLDKIYKMPHKLLSDYVDEDGIQRGVSPDLKDAFIVNDEIIDTYKLEKEYIKNTVTGGKQIKRYYIIDQGRKLIYTNRKTNFKEIPNICKFIDQFKSRITCVEVKQKKHSIYSLHRAREEKIFTKAEKIIGVITEDEIIVALDYECFYPTDGAYLFAAKDIEAKYIVSILNSKLFVFLYRLISMEFGRTLAQVKPTTISKLPIIVIDEDNVLIKNRLISLVSQILESKKQLQASKTDKDKTYWERKCEQLDNAIDSEVYKLYGLSDEEIKIVVGGK